MTAPSPALAAAGVLAAAHLCLLSHRFRRALWSLRWISRAVRADRRTAAPAASGEASRLVVLLPCLNEQSLVRETLDYFSSMPGVVEGRVLLVPVTGASEEALNHAAGAGLPPAAGHWWKRFDPAHFARHNRGLLPLGAYADVAAIRAAAASAQAFQCALSRYRAAVPSTAALVDDWISAAPAVRGRQVLRLHEPASRGTKASKLNFAVRTLKASHPRLMAAPRTYVAVYDFDSRPARDTFAWVLGEVDDRAARGEPLPTVFQQVPHTLGSGVEALSPASLPVVWAYAHLERTLGLEAGDLALETVRGRHASGRPRGCMGAGMFLRAADLDHVGPFPVDSDDIAFGFRLDWLGAPRALIPHPNLVQPVPSVGALVRQMRRIFRAVWTQRRELAWVRRNRPDVPCPRAGRRLLTGVVAERNCELRFLTFAGSVLLAWGAAPEAAAAIGLGLYAAEAAVLLALIRMGGRLAELHGAGIRTRAPVVTALCGALVVPALRLALLTSVSLERPASSASRARASSGMPALAELKTDR